MKPTAIHNCRGFFCVHQRSKGLYRKSDLQGSAVPNTCLKEKRCKALLECFASQNVLVDGDFNSVEIAWL